MLGIRTRGSRMAGVTNPLSIGSTNLARTFVGGPGFYRIKLLNFMTSYEVNFVESESSNGCLIRTR